MKDIATFDAALLFFFFYIDGKKTIENELAVLNEMNSTECQIPRKFIFQPKQRNTSKYKNSQWSQTEVEI